MQEEKRRVRFDPQLGLEAYWFQGLQQKFPNHFHEYYVVGLIEKGRRYLSCKNKDYMLEEGDMILFNARDNHTCEQTDEAKLDFRALNIPIERMEQAMEEISGKPFLPYFSQTVIHEPALAGQLRDLHRMIFEGDADFGKEEAFLFLIERLSARYAAPLEAAPAVPEGVGAVCAYLEEHYAAPTSLDALAKLAGMNPYSLLRAFTKGKGITPYRYLQTIRISRAKVLLEQGADPVEAALATGFSDQSHFTNYFKEFIGLTPGQYQAVFRGQVKD